ncbi:uncharacterized protein LOC111861918 isoform X2 [Cryptotermes secundus]|uniref:uncharacterized protein LOC111861918 isoform X2 n=1 Tax=Cryptotermes secundus TaxID=105785 RepID=UPI000CD7D2D7|nr:uncharacterized protein LOC111861918 isoform X2 [Cryptotermes secundus]
MVCCLFISKHETTKELYVVLMTILTSHCNCNYIPMICPDENITALDITCVGRSDCISEPGNFTWININQNTGKVTLQFTAFNKLCPGYYGFVLQSSENVTEDECKGSGFGQSYVTKDKSGVHWSDHSLRYGRIIKDQGNGSYPFCEKVVNVTFNLIYRGCYRLKIKKEYNLKVQAFCSPPVFLDTKFTKEDILKSTSLTISSVHNCKHGQMEHTVTGIDEMHISLMEFKVWTCQSGEKCASCAELRYVWWMGLNLAGEFKCIYGKNVPDCSLIEGNELRCITENVSNQSQCLWVHLHCHPCEGLGVWKNSVIHNLNPGCQWNSPTRDTCVVNYIPVLAEGDQCVTVILVSVFSSLVVLCFCILLFIMRKKIRKWLHYAPLTPTSYPLVPILSEVLLLYPRDCEQFMNLMVTLRNTLQEVMKCKVYDCYDPSIEEEIATGAVEWLNRHLRHDGIKIVVVETECAVLHQKASFQGKRVFYQHPTWLDDIFSYGLKELANDTSGNQYNRVFVVCVRGFSDVNEELNLITPNTRYVIPQHMEELMTNLYRWWQHTNRVTERDIPSPSVITAGDKSSDS